MPEDAPPPEPITRWAAGGGGASIWLNATGVALDGHGIAILGAPGSGKSSLALALLALGASLIADDGIWLDMSPPLLRRPPQARDLIEARGIGLLRAGATVERAGLALVVDLDRAEPHRLPPRRYVATAGTLHPLILGAGHNTLAPALALMVRHGRADP